jgi:Yip1 domain
MLMPRVFRICDPGAVSTSEQAQGKRLAEPERLQRDWWLRVAAVLLAPRAVFVALRDDSDQAAEARQEPVLAIVGLAGIAGVLLTSVARHVLNEPGTSPIVVPVWAFIGGAFYGALLYWLGGAILYAAARGLGSLGSYRRARHVLAYSLVPLALSLLTLWPIRIAVYRSDLFRTGGDDYARGDAIFGAIAYGLVGWSVLLLVIGVRAVHGWTWLRALGAIAIAAVFPALLALAKLL